MSNEKLKKDSEPKFPYLTIALCFLMILFGLGLWGPKGLFVAPITSALDISRSLYSITDTMRYISMAVVNMFFGALINKFGSKKLILAGFACLVVAATLFAVAEGVIVFYLGGLLLGVGLSWTGTAIVGFVVNKAVKKNRGTIMGFILAANGIGGAITTWIITPFLSDPNNPFGYRIAYFVMAGILVLVFTILAIFYREPKINEGQTTDKKKNNARGEGWVGIEYNKAVKKAYFYGACVCIFFTGMVLQGVTSIYAAHMSDVGIEQSFISIVATISSVALSFSKFLNGFMYDRIGLRVTITIDCISAIGVMCVLFFLTNSPLGFVLAVVYALLAAVALPLETVMLPIYASDLFGDKSFNKILGIFLSINQIGYALGAPLLNLCFDLTGSYKIALILCALVMLAVVVLLQIIISSAHKMKKQVLMTSAE